MSGTYKLKITEEPLDADDNAPKGRVELLNLFYIKYLSYNLFGYSFLYLEGHSMKSKFVIATSDEEYKPKRDDPVEGIMQRFMKVQVTDFEKYLQYSLSRQINIYFSYSNGRMNIKAKARYRMQKFNLADVLYTMYDLRYTMTDAVDNEVWYDGKLYKITKVI